jgi:hypothetical protein
MKTIKPYQIVLGTFLICSFLFFSCRVSKTTALKCPQVSTKENNEVLVKYKKNKNTTYTPKYRANIRKEPVRQLISLSRNNHGKYIDVFNNSPNHENVIVSGPAYLNGLTKIEYNKRLTASIDETVIPLRKNNLTRFQTEKAETRNHPVDKIVIPTDRCDTIIFKSGYSVICKILEIGENILSYIKCDDLRGPVYSISKSDVLEIRANNGKKILVNSSFASPYRTDNVKSGSAGFIISLIGFILFAILFKEYFIGAFALAISEIPIAPFIIVILTGFTGILLGIKSLIKIIRHSDYYKGKLFAILSIGIGGFDIILVVLLVIILLLTLLIASLV